MSEPANIRLERITRLLRELEYEVTRGIMEREIDEEVGYRFMIPVSQKIPGGIVGCEFRTRPAMAYEGAFYGTHPKPRLRVVAASDDSQ